MGGWGDGVSTGGGGGGGAVQIKKKTVISKKKKVKYIPIISQLAFYLNLCERLSVQ